MANNKVVLSNGTTLIDLSEDTLTSASMVQNGITAHLANGTQVTGTLSFVTYYTGTTDPSDSFGNDGDIYLKVVS